MSTTKQSIKTLKEGKLLMLEGEPCKVLDVAVSASGKHGAAKVRLDAVGMFDNKKRSIVKPADTEVEVPIVEKKNAQVVAITPPTVQLMDLETYETFESPIPDELKDKLQQGAEVMYWIIEGRKMLVSVRGS
ncbi:MAG: translation initiation factor IF-5A [Candidatus Aenigmatarchaeota archaeon]